MKKTKTIEIEETYCDICGKPADGEHILTTSLNDYFSETKYCPFDLCKEHMMDYDSEIVKKIDEVNEEFIYKMKKKYEEEEIGYY